MQIRVKLGVSDDSLTDVLVNLTKDDPTISEILGELRKKLSPWYVAVMERGIKGLDGPDGVDSVVGGLDSLPKKASLFLSLESENGLKKLDSTKHVSYYEINSNSTLLLMCSSEYLDEE